MTHDPATRGEHRWPMATAVLFLTVLPFLVPSRLTLNPRWIIPVIEVALLVALIAGDPGRIDRRDKWLRRNPAACSNPLPVRKLSLSLRNVV